MNGEIPASSLEHRVSSGIALNRFTECVDLWFGRPRRGKPRGCRLYHFSHLDQVVERDVLPSVMRAKWACCLGGRCSPYKSAASRRDLDQAVFDEATQSLAY